MSGRPSRHLSRRQLIRSGAAASVLAMSALDGAAAPRRGGTLRIAAPEGEVFDRLVAPGSVFDCLTEVDATGTLRGELAESWSARGEGNLWQFTLARDAALHDRAPLTADHVIGVLRPLIGRPGPLESVRGIRKTGPLQVQFALGTADPQFPFRLADPAAALGSGDAPGTGLYRPTEAGPGCRVKLARVEDHWRAARSGWFDRVELLGLGGRQARLDALLSGRVDLAFDLAPEARRVIARARRLDATVLRVALSSGDVALLAGHSLRLRGLDGREPLRIAERGFFA